MKTQDKGSWSAIFLIEVLNTAYFVWLCALAVHENSVATMRTG